MLISTYSIDNLIIMYSYQRFTPFFLFSLVSILKGKYTKQVPHKEVTKRREAIIKNSIPIIPLNTPPKKRIKKVIDKRSLAPLSIMPMFAFIILLFNLLNKDIKKGIKCKKIN